jgi:hypothetical protein
MSRMTATAPLPDPSVMRDVLRLCDAVTAAIRRQPPGPLCYCPADDWFEPESQELIDLREYLRALSDDHQAALHAIYWLGRGRRSRARQYGDQYRYALRTDLGDHGAAYLAAKANLGDKLRRGLEKLGLDRGWSDSGA